MTNHYEIEIIGGPDDHYSTTIVTGPAAPAGTVPECITRHAELLGDIARADEINIGQTWPTRIAADGVQHASTVWLTTTTRNSDNDADDCDPDGIPYPTSALAGGFWL